MWVNEHLPYSSNVYKLLSKAELFIPLTWLFHLFEKKSENEYIVFLYPFETVKNVKVGEELQKFDLTISTSREGIKYLLEDTMEKIKYAFILSSSVTSRTLNVMVGVEKKGLFTSIPIEPRHILEHLSYNLKFLRNE